MGGNSSAGRAQASQAWGRGFEPRFPLQVLPTPSRGCRGGVGVWGCRSRNRGRSGPFGAAIRHAEVGVRPRRTSRFPHARRLNAATFRSDACPQAQAAAAPRPARSRRDAQLSLTAAEIERPDAVAADDLRLVSRSVRFHPIALQSRILSHRRASSDYAARHGWNSLRPPATPARPAPSSTWRSPRPRFGRAAVK